MTITWIIIIVIIGSIILYLIRKQLKNYYVMEIKIVRDTFTDKTTIGKMYIDGTFFCDTLEDKVRDKKIQGQTAIPKGTYDTIIDYSNRFKKNMPHILDVPNFEGIRIHSGNTAENTDGCILLGQRSGKDFVGNSKNTFNAFMKLITDFQLKTKMDGKIKTTIENK